MRDEKNNSKATKTKASSKEKKNTPSRLRNIEDLKQKPEINIKKLTYVKVTPTKKEEETKNDTK